MSGQAIVVLVLKVSIVLTVFVFGLRAGPEDLLFLLRRPRLLARSLLAIFVIMPVFAVVLTSVFHFIPAVRIALIALSISPVPPLLPGRIAKSGGHASYGLGLMVTAASLSILLVPLITFLIGKYFDKPLAVGPSAIVALIVPAVLAPLCAGILVHRFFPKFASHIARPLGIFAGVLLLLGALSILIFAMPAAWSLVGNGTLMAFVVFIVAGLAVGHCLGGRTADERVPLALSTACRQPALAIAIASAKFPQERRVVGAVLLYVLLNAMLTIPYVQWQRKKAKALAASS